MSPHENSILTELIGEVRDMRTDLVVIRTKLFGDNDEETIQGRIPRIEADLERHDRKLRRWEPIHLLLRGAWVLLAGAGGYLIDNFVSNRGR